MTWAFFAALDVSQEKTAICIVDDRGAILAEGKVATCPQAIAHWLKCWSQELEKIGMETGPLAVWLWNTLATQACRSSSSTRGTPMPP